MSFLRTTFLMAAMTSLFLMFGFMLGGTGGMTIAFMIAAAMNLFAYWNSDRMVLSMHGAREVDERSAPELVAMVRSLARQADLPMPKVYIIDNAQPNAFATGRNPENAAVAATTGLLKILNREEIEGVMAHELAHVKNRDTLIMTLTATIAGAIGMLANFAMFFGGNRDNPLGFFGTILMMILAPIAALLVQTAISRTREFSADKTGGEICGNPLALARALEKLHHVASRTINEPAEQNPATAHMFIVNPLNGKSLDSLFSTHPDMAVRIARLEEQAQIMGSRPVRSHNPRQNPQGTRRQTRSTEQSGSGVPLTGGRRENPNERGPWG